MTVLKSKKVVLSAAVATIAGFVAATSINAATIQYEYDSLNRLIRVLYDGKASIEYAYDAVGNRTRRVVTTELPTTLTGDFCGANFGPTDGYVDVWDLMQFADHWHVRTGQGNWDGKFDLAGPDFGDPDGYVDAWDLMVFADHWREGEKP
ncbi:MAG: hypothetical protein AMJ75_00065 [Phycisphaerae bacterium SM1_79]|nr:MAG: hypothetical protein AMJ75_00065 [Phycisphaerae bacterium SM1_79]